MAGCVLLELGAKESALVGNRMSLAVRACLEFRSGTKQRIMVRKHIFSFVVLGPVEASGAQRLHLACIGIKPLL